MQQFWFTISKIKDSSSYKFKLDNKSYKVGLEVFCKVLQICNRLPKQKFVEPPSHEESISFIKEYKGDVESITNLITNHMYQPWRTFVVIINRCLSGKITSLDKLRLSRAQILWGIFTKANIQYFISKDNSISMRNRMFMNSTRNDSVLGTLKFVPKVGAAKPKKSRKWKQPTSALKKESSLTADDNIISDDPDAALELANSINRTKAEEQ
ncbi:hypothetical protein Tco_0961574, partial [Tanacetum coccineum]